MEIQIKPSAAYARHLPYVAVEEIEQGGLAAYEPSLALDGGADGLEKIYELYRQLDGRLRARGCLLLEVGDGQAEPVVNSLRGFSPPADIEVFADLGGIGRVVGLHY